MNQKIPKILHFCFGFAPDFGGKPFGLPHFASIRSAIEKIRPTDAFLYYEYEPDNVWWHEIKKYVTPVHIQAPLTIFGNPLSHPAHRADVVRLEQLLKTGGIYLDCDVIVHKDFDPLLSHPAVLGRQGRFANYGLANAIILAQPDAPFLQRWYNAYHGFRGRQNQFWDEHSCILPLYLSRQFPSEIEILPYDAFYYPTWSARHIEDVFNGAQPIDLTHAYANHFWESRAWAYLDRLTPGDVRKVETNFHRWIRAYVQDYADDFGAVDQLEWESRSQSLRHLAIEGIIQPCRDLIRFAFPPSSAYLSQLPRDRFEPAQNGEPKSLSAGVTL